MTITPFKGQQAYSIINLCVFVYEHNSEGDQDGEG